MLSVAQNHLFLGSRVDCFTPVQVQAFAGVLLREVTEPAVRRSLKAAIEAAAAAQAADPDYGDEIALWSGRHGSEDGVPAANAPAATLRTPRQTKRPIDEPNGGQPGKLSAGGWIPRVPALPGRERQSRG